MSDTMNEIMQKVPGIATQHQHMHLYLLSGPFDVAIATIAELGINEHYMVPMDDHFVLACLETLDVKDNVLEKAR
jgi:hypothetical protein